MSEQVLLQDLEDGVLTLTFNRPERLNAFNPALMRAFTEAIGQATKNPEARVVVIRGAGRGFCAGGDLSGKPKKDPSLEPASKPEKPKAPDSLATRIDWLRGNMDATRQLFEMPKPTIAMIRGATVSVGMAIGAACDFRVVSDNASFMTGFAKAGLSGDYGVSYFLTRLLGTAKTRELMLLGERIDATEALRIGYASRLVDDAALEDNTYALARQLAAGSSIIQRYIKQNLNAALEMPLPASLDLEATLNVLSAQTNDHKEAVSAFIERRDPVFSGS
ncbi:enoyl-CoA hydratase [Pseudomonas umsongensis]|uniref:enoyl-CoA hydratase n=1 Tax=Pseudomonas umsongensis TaxID=198618 RepID=UPI00200A0DB8|nr:enoyl-CoA hydratase [Pseudomonas umsongensis]MCK8682734.1 enoyl-CoA hydratase [Pseudomonas umsongensis]